MPPFASSLLSGAALALFCCTVFVLAGVLAS